MGFGKALKKAAKFVKKNALALAINPGYTIAREMDKGFTDTINKATGNKYAQFLPPSGTWLPAMPGNDDFRVNAWRNLQGVVPTAVQPYAPVVGGIIGNIWGPAGSAAGTYIGSKVAGQHGAQPVINAGLAYGASYGANALAGGGSAAGGAGGSSSSDLMGFANEGWIPATTSTSGAGTAAGAASGANGGFSWTDLVGAYGRAATQPSAGGGTAPSTGGGTQSGGSWYTNPLVINTLGSLASGWLGADASKDAAKEQKKTADAAIANYWNQYYAAQEANKPWRDTGVNALGKLNVDFERFNRPFTMEDFKANIDPGYEFRLNEGIKARDRSAAARGELFSGAHQKEMERFGQDFAANEYQSAWNRYVDRQNREFNQLANMAGIGQTATRDLTQVGSNTAGNVGNALITGGNAAAAGKVGAAQAWSDALQNAAGDYLWWQGRKDAPNALYSDYMRKFLTQKGAV